MFNIVAADVDPPFSGTVSCSDSRSRRADVRPGDSAVEAGDVGQQRSGSSDPTHRNVRKKPPGSGREKAGVRRMRAGQAGKGRHAECAYLLDRAVKDPTSTEDFARAALDTIRLALRPSYAAVTCRVGPRIFRFGDKPLASDLDAAAEILASAPRSLLTKPQSIRRSETAALSLARLERTMTSSALEVVLPLADDASLIGLVALGPRPDRTPYSADDLEFCDRIGARLSLVAAREALAAEVTLLRAAAASSERLASVGRMATGLAHEIRNPLVSIRTFTQLLPERHADEEFRNGFLDLTLAEIDRISTLVGEILSFARSSALGGETEEASAADIGDCVGRTCLLLRSHARSAGVALDFDCEDLAERAVVDEDKLRQVVINLVVNGIQACDGRGRVRVAVSQPPCATHAASRIVIEISDDGPGMTSEVASRIFEPFFTTRREGTGLGLALVRTILDDAGATIAVDSTPGAGTTFRVELLPESLAGTSVSGRSGRLLDDEPEFEALEALVP
jgi:signal transduction histidine kinase